MPIFYQHMPYKYITIFMYIYIIYIFCSHRKYLLYIFQYVHGVERRAVREIKKGYCNDGLGDSDNL